MGRRRSASVSDVPGRVEALEDLGYQELRADTIAAAGGGLLYRGANPNGASFRPIFGAWYELAHLNSSGSGSRFAQSGTAGMLVPTPLGLLGLTFSADLNGSTRFRVSIGSFWNRP